MVRRLRIVVVTVLLVLGVVACGDDDTGTTATPTSTTSATAATTAPTTTAAPTTSEAPTTTTLPADAHPELGVSWAAVLPPEGATATYAVFDYGIDLELEARMEYRVPFRDATVDRIVFGSAEPGRPGLVFYLDLSEPWMVTIHGSEVYGNRADGPEMLEWFEVPLVFDLLAPVGETRRTDGIIHLEFGTGGGIVEDIAVDIALVERGVDATVPAGTFAVSEFDIGQGGGFMGGTRYPLRVLVSADQLFVASYGGEGARFPIELVEPWG